jgi:hypothetical protein
MKRLLRIFGVIHAMIAAFFALSALVLMGTASRVLWQAFTSGFDHESAVNVIDGIGLIAIAVVALQMAQTIAEEEVIRSVHISGPTRVRRFLSRFLVVVVVALAVEGLVATFKAIRSHPENLASAAAIEIAAGILLAGWGLFLRLNRSVEELEPEAMEEAKQEDHKLDSP